MTNEETTEVATFAAGCFWGVEADFRKIPGVYDAVSGYTGGHVENPNYRLVCSDTTGHAEAVDVTFDPAKVSYERLVEAFFAMHDPTTPNRQGPDRGSQYRSAIFVHSPEQREVAERVIARLTQERRFRNPIVTEVVDAKTFYPAEEYHQRYFEKQGILAH